MRWIAEEFGAFRYLVANEAVIREDNRALILPLRRHAEAPVLRDRRAVHHP
jgi:hypothetical protein